MSLYLALAGRTRIPLPPQKDVMPVTSKTTIEQSIGMKRPLVVVPPAAPVPGQERAAGPSAAETFADTDIAAESATAAPPIEYERKFVVPESALAKVRTIPGVQRRMVYDTYIEPAAAGQPRMRFRFETSIDPLLGNSEDGTPVISYADFTVKTGSDASKRVETIYPLVFRRPDTIATINAFSSIHGVRVRSERYRWTGTEGSFQLVIYTGERGQGGGMVVEIETASEAELWAFSPPKTWREVTHTPGFSNYSIASCGWPAE